MIIILYLILFLFLIVFIVSGIGSLVYKLKKTYEFIRQNWRAFWNS